jgi:hypothetical protein
MIDFTVQCLMDLEIESLTGGPHGSPGGGKELHPVYES